MKRYFGCHVSAAGGLENALTRAKELDVNTIQIHPSPPQRWNFKPFPKGVEDEFLKLRPESGVEKVFFHGIYLINLANPDKQKLHLSKSSLVHYLDLAARLDGDGVIFHVGSMKDQEDEAAGYDQIAGALDWILKESDDRARLLLEVAAGSGQVIGSKVEQLARIYEGVAETARLGFALDTQHMWASGYDLQNELEEIVERLKKVFGLEKIWAIHLNDSKTELASKKDRHENLGRGLIGSDTLRRVVNHPGLKKIPFILETPGLAEMDTAKQEVEALREMVFVVPPGDTNDQ